MMLIRNRIHQRVLVGREAATCAVATVGSLCKEFTGSQEIIGIFRIAQPEVAPRDLAEFTCSVVA
jgi:hypothetical protein